MEHSVNFEKVKSYYDEGFWDIHKVFNAVIKHWITKQEYEEITGQNF